MDYRAFSSHSMMLTPTCCTWLARYMRLASEHEYGTLQMFYTVQMCWEGSTHIRITTQNCIHSSRTGDKDQNLSAKLSCEILIYLDRGLTWALGGTRLSIPDLMGQYLNVIYTLILFTCVLRISFVEIHATCFLCLKVLREEANCFEQIQEK